MNKYGVPLDNRSDYTKTDWEIWATVLCEDDTLLRVVTDRIWDNLNENNKISLYVRYISLEDGKVESRMINKFKKV